MSLTHRAGCRCPTCRPAPPEPAAARNHRLIQGIFDGLRPVLQPTDSPVDILLALLNAAESTIADIRDGQPTRAPDDMVRGYAYAIEYFTQAPIREAALAQVAAAAPDPPLIPS